MLSGRPNPTVESVGAWMLVHRRIMYVIFLVLAGLNGWLSYNLFSRHPFVATANAVMALLLAIFVISTWGLK